MNVNIEKKEGLEVAIKVDIPLARVDALKEQKFKGLAKTANVKGFRPGKVPRAILEKHYGGAVQQEAEYDLMKSSFEEAIQQEKLELAGYPHFHPQEIISGDSFSYSATVEVFPEIDLKKLKGVMVEKVTAEVTGEDVKKTLQDLAKQYGQWEPVTRASQSGDQLLIDFEGFVDGVAFEGGVAKDFTLELGAGQMIPGFESGLEKVKVGDELDLEVSFPEEYHATNLAGKPAVFKIKVNRVAEHQPRPIDEAFAKLLGVASGSLEDLHSHIEANLQRELAFALRSEFVDRVFDAVLVANPIPLPKALVDEEIKRIQKDMMKQLGIGADKQALFEQLASASPGEFETRAERNVRLGLLLRHAAEVFAIEPDEERVKGLIELRASSYDNPEEIVAAYYSDKKYLKEIEWRVSEEMLAEAFAEEATVTEVKKTFREVMKPEEEQSTNQ